MWSGVNDILGNFRDSYPINSWKLSYLNAYRTLETVQIFKQLNRYWKNCISDQHWFILLCSHGFYKAAYLEFIEYYYSDFQGAGCICCQSLHPNSTETAQILSAYCMNELDVNFRTVSSIPHSQAIAFLLLDSKVSRAVHKKCGRPYIFFFTGE